MVHADQKPFLASENNVDAHLYDDNVETIKLVRQDSKGKPIKVIIQKIRGDDASITEEFEELCRELTSPCLSIGPEK